MEVDAITQLILEYRYWILLPLSFIEGPVIAFVAGTLASGGYFSLPALASFFFARDIAVDALCYFLGFFSAHTRFIKALLKRLGVIDDHMDEVATLWNAHPGKTMFFSKLSYGLAAGFIVVAGMVKMPFRIFIYYGSIIAVVHYGVLLITGYFFGAAFGGTFIAVLHNLPLALAIVGTISVIYYIFRRYTTKKLKRMEETGEV